MTATNNAALTMIKLRFTGKLLSIRAVISNGFGHIRKLILAAMRASCGQRRKNRAENQLPTMQRLRILPRLDENIAGSPESFLVGAWRLADSNRANQTGSSINWRG